MTATLRATLSGLVLGAGLGTLDAGWWLALLVVVGGLAVATASICIGDES